MLITWVQIHPFRDSIVFRFGPHGGIIVGPFHALLGPCVRCGTTVLCDPFERLGPPTALVTVILDDASRCIGTEIRIRLVIDRPHEEAGRDRRMSPTISVPILIS